MPSAWFRSLPGYAAKILQPRLARNAELRVAFLERAVDIVHAEAVAGGTGVYGDGRHGVVEDPKKRWATPVIPKDSSFTEDSARRGLAHWPRVHVFSGDVERLSD